MRLHLSKSLFCFFLLLSQFSVLIRNQETTVQIIGILRSGNSYPASGFVQKFIENPQYTEDSQLHSEISGNGLRSAYILGQDLLNRYPFLKESSQKLVDFTMIASKTNRTLMTAQAVMLGIFGLNNDTRKVEVLDEFQQPPFNGETVPNTFDTPLPNGIYPVPFESFNKEFNNVLRPWDAFGCKEFEALTKDQLEDKSHYIDKFSSIIKLIKTEVSHLIYFSSPSLFILNFRKTLIYLKFWGEAKAQSQIILMLSKWPHIWKE